MERAANLRSSGNDAVGVATGARGLLVGRDRSGLGDDAVGVSTGASGLFVGGRVDDDGGGGEEGVHCDVGSEFVRLTVEGFRLFSLPL